MALDIANDGNRYFNNSDSTALLSTVAPLNMPWQPSIQVLLIAFRVLAMFTSIAVSIILLSKERCARTGFYVFSCIYTFAIQLTNIAVASPGIHNFFRKLHVSHYLGMIQFPWIIYSLIVILPIVITAILLSMEIRKIWKLEKI